MAAVARLVLKALDGDGAEREVPGGKPFFMGRGADNDWVLDDPAREISKVHCRIDGDGSAHLLTDMSINGVHLERENRLLGRGNRHRLAAGDVFAVGPHRFAVVAAADARDASPAERSPAPPPRAGAEAPGRVGDILDGRGAGTEPRAAAALAGEAQAWLGDLPMNSAAEGLARPLGWDDPPAIAAAADGAFPPADVDAPPSRFVDGSEHLPATASAMALPAAARPPTGPLLPSNWLDDDAEPAAAPGPAARAGSPPAGSAPADAGAARRALAGGLRLDEAALSALRDPALFARAGALVRAFSDGLDGLEAAQAAAESDCGLAPVGEAALWTDFLSAARDPCLQLLADGDEDALGGLARRLGMLADRQRALGAALAEAAAEWDRRLGPDALAGPAVPWFAAGPLGRATLWDRYAEAHAALRHEHGGDDGGDAGGGHLLSRLVRRAFARRLPGI